MQRRAHGASNMNSKEAELRFQALYTGASKELLDLVMAAERAFRDDGKFSVSGENKGEEAKWKFVAALVHAIGALERIGKVTDAKNSEESFAALEVAMALIKDAYPKRTRAFRYWDSFTADPDNI